MVDGLIEEKLCPMLGLRSGLDSSPGLGRAGSLRFMLIATCDRRLSDSLLGKRGEPRLLVEDLLEISAAFILAAAAREVDVDCLLVGDGLD